MSTLELEVTILITVDRDDYPGMTDDQIRDYVQCDTANEIEIIDWDSVTVRVAPTEPETGGDG